LSEGSTHKDSIGAITWRLNDVCDLISSRNQNIYNEKAPLLKKTTNKQKSKFFQRHSAIINSRNYLRADMVLLRQHARRCKFNVPLTLKISFQKQRP